MSPRLTTLAVSMVATLLATALAAADDSKEEKTVPPAPPAATAPAISAVLNFTMNNLDGQPVELSQYRGKVVLMVNTASKCGYTPQYKALQALHEKYAGKGLAILGFPANDFGKQEPGIDKDIAEFCEKNYGVKFDMFSKVSVKGAGQCPLYKFLTSAETNPRFPGEVKWNFEKFLLDREGKIVNRFGSKTKPDSEEMVKAIEAELNKPKNGI